MHGYSADGRNSGAAQPHVVVIGGGFGGLAAARGLATAPVRVTLIDKTNHHLFQPLLYQVATAGLSPADIAEPIRSLLARQRNVEVLLAEVTGVDTAARQVLLDDRRLDYDYLVIATGATHSYFGRPDWKLLAPGLKTIEDATEIRRRILLAFEKAEMEPNPGARAALLTFAVVGGGPTGVEMAGAIAELARKALRRDFRRIDPTKTRVLLLEAGPRILSAYPEELSLRAVESLGELGVEVRTGARVEEISEEGVLTAEACIPCRTVIWAAGVAASPAARWLGAQADRSGRVEVGPDLRVPGQDRVFVIGDTALCMQDGRALPGIAPVAMQQGRYVARVIVSAVCGRSAPPAFRYKDKGSLATIGRSRAVAVVYGRRIHGFFAWLAWVVIHIWYLTDFQNRLLVMLQWAWAYFTFKRGARLIVPGIPPSRHPHQTAEEHSTARR